MRETWGSAAAVVQFHEIVRHLKSVTSKTARFADFDTIFFKKAANYPFSVCSPFIMLKGCALDPIFATVSYTTEVSTRHFDFPVATSVRVARLAIDRRLSLRGRIKHMNDEVIMDTEFLVANTHYKYIEFFDADELLEQNVRMTATKASTEVLREKALELLVRKLDQDVENIVAKRQKRMQMVKDANTAFHSDYSEPSE